MIDLDEGNSHSALLKVENLAVSIGERLLVDDVSFEIRAGETVCLVGESGSGKSVTASAIIGLLPAGLNVTSGRITLGRHDMLAADGKTLEVVRGREIGIIFQEPLSALNPIMPVGDQIAEVFAVHGERPDKERIHALLREVGYRDPERIAASYPHRLSGGQRQRIVIAMAIALNPKLIIADEPTTALDVTTQAQVLELLDQIRRQHGCAMLFVTHDFGVVADIADRVAVMREGRIVEAAPAGDLFAHPEADYTRTLLAAVAERPTRATAELEGDVAVEIEGLSKIYQIGSGLFAPVRHFTALAGASLTVRRGETLGIIGESGSGKSTLAKALVGLVRPDAGRISIEGVDVTASERPADLPRRIQMVFQDPYASLNPRRRIGSMLADGPRAFGVPARQVKSEIQEMLTLVGLPEDAASRFPHEFSGGQRQRIAIARALVMRPSVLVADEPVSALDVSIQRQILDLFGSIRKQFDLTMLFITHDLRVAAEICDRLAIMREGAIVEYNWTRDILAQPADAYTRQLLAAVPGREKLAKLASRQLVHRQ